MLVWEVDGVDMVGKQRDVRVWVVSGKGKRGMRCIESVQEAKQIADSAVLQAKCSYIFSKAAK